MIRLTYEANGLRASVAIDPSVPAFQAAFEGFQDHAAEIGKFSVHPAMTSALSQALPGLVQGVEQLSVNLLEAWLLQVRKEREAA